MLISWWISQIFKKVFKTIPSFANLDASTAVMRKRFYLGISAPIEHILPNAISSIAGFSVLPLCRKPVFVTVAPATFRVPSNKICRFAYRFLSAITKTKPQALAVFAAEIAHYKQSAKSLTFNIFEFIVFWFRDKWNVNICVRHFAYSPLAWISSLFRLAQVLVASVRAVFILPQMRIYE